MKCIILAGGTGSRLKPLTVAVNKHLLPIGTKPMIQWPIEVAVESGIENITIVTNPEYISGFAALMSCSGYPYDRFKSVTFAAQNKPLGIADAIKCAKTARESIFVLLGDNIFTHQFQFKEVIRKATLTTNLSCHIWVRQVDNFRDYGILEYDEYGRPSSIKEKPQESTSRKAVVGAYLFSSKVWDYIDELKISDRNEYEVTDLIRRYLEVNKLVDHNLLGDWSDPGSSLKSYISLNNRLTENFTV